MTKVPIFTSNNYPQQPAPMGDTFCQSPSVQSLPFHLFPWCSFLPGLGPPPGSRQVGRGALTASQLPFLLSLPLHLILLMSFILETCLCSHVDISDHQAIAISARTSSVSWKTQSHILDPLIPKPVHTEICLNGFVPWSPPSLHCLVSLVFCHVSFLIDPSLYITVMLPSSSNVLFSRPGSSLQGALCSDLWTKHSDILGSDPAVPICQLECTENQWVFFESNYPE